MEAMREQIVGLFEREQSAAEAAQMLQAAGYSCTDLDLVTNQAIQAPGQKPCTVVKTG